ncbi:MAG: leucyl aminopeptidase family protein [Alphaproteobacteria bacterium]|nr:leucyl aminopeptidase family protein [Alphaproteobacteria bacterium]
MPYFSHHIRHTKAIIPLDATAFPAWLKKQDARTRNWVAAQAFQAAPQTALLVPDAAGDIACVLAGVEATPTLWSLAHLPALLPGGNFYIDAKWKPALLSRVALGFALAQYQFDRYKKSPRKSLVLQLPKAIDLAALAAEHAAIVLVRDLINTPANDMGTADLAKAARAVAKQTGAKFREIVGDDLLRENYPAIHAVGRAGSQPPRLIELTHGKAAHPLVVLVGKGVTFDTGGLDIKPYAGMRLMKKDMGGAALVLGLAQRIIAAGLPIRLRVLIPAAENSISSNAFRPQDVIASRKGLTIEIGSTDAEGRLILADALAEGDRDNPALMIDVATLTGAARAALGTELPALYSNREEIARELAHISLAAHDPMWPLPLWQGYAKYVSSTIADVTNTPAYGFAGSITAALFLERFVSPGTPWVHIDSYAWNAESQPGRPAGGEALGLRSLFAYLEKRFGTA